MSGRKGNLTSYVVYYSYIDQVNNRLEEAVVRAINDTTVCRVLLTGL